MFQNYIGRMMWTVRYIRESSNNILSITDDKLYYKLFSWMYNWVNNVSLLCFIIILFKYIILYKFKIKITIIHLRNLYKLI